MRSAAGIVGICVLKTHGHRVRVVAGQGSVVEGLGTPPPPPPGTVPGAPQRQTHTAEKGRAGQGGEGGAISEGSPSACLPSHWVVRKRFDSHTRHFLSVLPTKGMIV